MLGDRWKEGRCNDTAVLAGVLLGRLHPLKLNFLKGFLCFKVCAIFGVPEDMVETISGGTAKRLTDFRMKNKPHLGSEYRGVFVWLFLANFDCGSRKSRRNACAAFSAPLNANRANNTEAARDAMEQFCTILA